MTYDEFTKDPSNRKALAAALADPALVAGIEIVRGFMMPKRGGQSDAAPAMAAAYLHQIVGANYLVDKLHLLSKEPVESKGLKNKAMAKTPEDVPADFQR